MPGWVKGVLVLVITLSAGVALGITYERRRPMDHNAGPMDSRHVVEHLERELELDSTQQRAIAAIFARHQRSIDSTWHTMQPHVHAALDSTLSEVTGVLRPDQLARYRRLVRERHQGTLHP